ncbi:MAG: NAD(+) diphosphatase, partial [Treponema sp.]|nr:NAD(+) diphosphatase [Treponema sp.]
KLIDDKNLVARNCSSCKAQYFPRIEPCVIVLISKGDKILLARHKERNQNIYTCIAGFIELGESIEQAVLREIREELGIEIQNLRYVGSQGWPFPDQLMLAFRAEYKSGKIKVQEDELYEARWFLKSELPPFAKRGSIGYKLISGFYG